ncbi:hypothetical protein [Coleofasciculus sp.]|uniref:hypothetical protein n=1 Tax=Coleofasciculus sp. TaxID=3100458 RepID=UPI0039F9BBC9
MVSNSYPVVFRRLQLLALGFNPRRLVRLSQPCQNLRFILSLRQESASLYNNRYYCPERNNKRQINPLYPSQLLDSEKRLAVYAQIVGVKGNQCIGGYGRQNLGFPT